jgi:hypothetical protein
LIIVIIIIITTIVVMMLVISIILLSNPLTNTTTERSSFNPPYLFTFEQTYSELVILCVYWHMQRMVIRPLVLELFSIFFFFS